MYQPRDKAWQQEAFVKDGVVAGPAGGLMHYGELAWQ